MAQARITLTCSCCGKSFDHRHTCYNRSEANSYEEWARENITLCPDCYASSRRESEMERFMASLPEGHRLPELTGASDKQIAYASRLRESFIRRSIIGRIDIADYLAYCDEIRLDRLDPAECEQSAAEAGQSVADWYAQQRCTELCFVYGITARDTVAKIDAIFAISDAGRLIEALKAV